MARKILYPQGGLAPLPPPTTLGWNDNNIAITASRALIAAVVLFDAFNTWPPFQVPASPSNTDVNWQILNPEPFAKPFPVGAQQYVAHANFQIPTAKTPQGWNGFQFDYAFKPPFPAADQQFLVAFEPEGTITTSLPDGWRTYAWDYQFAKPYPACAQPFPAFFQPRGTINSTTPQGWNGYQFDYAFAKPFAPHEQVFLALGPERVPRPSDVEGWFGIQFEYRFAKAIPAALQQHSNFQAAGTIRTSQPDGWRGAQYDIRFAPQFPAQDQQFLIYDPQFISNSVAFYLYPEPPFQFAKPFAAALQQFAYFQPQGDVPPFLPPGAGKYPKLPSYIPQPAWDKKPNKTFRPVWDKPRGGELEQHPQPVADLPAAPIPLPPADVFAQPAPANGLNLPGFGHLAQMPPDYDQHMRKVQQDAQDLADAVTVLKALGIMPS